MKLLLLLPVFLLGYMMTRAQTSCSYRNISYRTVNNIQNPSLEQLPTTCLTAVSGGDFTLLQGGYLPHWRCATTASSIWYLGECNAYGVPPVIDGIPGLPQPPLPIPDGKGMMAFADHVRVPVGRTNRNRATYLANCLASTLKKDFYYRFEFYLGFGKSDHRYDTVAPYSKFTSKIRSTSPTPETVTLYGFTDSNLLPINVPDTVLGCLTDLNKGWKELGTITVKGDSGTWVKSSIDFTAPANINVLAIGPACNSKTGNVPDGYYYYFVDNLHLYESYIPKPSISVTAGSHCDNGNAFMTLQMDYASIYQGSKFQWYRNNAAIPETGGSVTINKKNYGAGWYQCSVQNDSICARSDSLYVYWVAPPSLNVFNGVSSDACNGQTVVLNATTEGASYLWDDSTLLPTRSITQSGNYQVTIANACDTLTVLKTLNFKDCPTSFMVPSAFTPNGDGLNDVLKPHLTGTVTQYHFSVYNRMGRVIFTTADLSKGWDGTINRILQDPGTYVWMISYTDGAGNVKTDKGTVVLIR